MFHSCLICTDFSDGLHRLTSFIPSLANAGLTKIVLFHSVPFSEQGRIPRADSEQIQSAKQSLSTALTDVPSGVEVYVEVGSGQATENILRLIDTYQLDVILAGNPIRGDWQEKIFGSTSLDLAKLTSQPLMILRPQLISTYTTEELSLRCQHLWRYLLIPYTDSDAGRYLIQQIKEYAQKRPENSLQKCMLVSVVENVSRQTEIINQHLEEAQAKLESLKTELEELNLEVNIEVRQGDPVLETLSAALTFDISAIAVATDYRKNLLDWTVPSVANNFLSQSWFPLLFFSPKK